MDKWNAELGKEAFAAVPELKIASKDFKNWRQVIFQGAELNGGCFKLMSDDIDFTTKKNKEDVSLFNRYLFP
jgi:hypothetical protein